MLEAPGSHLGEAEPRSGVKDPPRRPLVFFFTCIYELVVSLSIWDLAPVGSSFLQRMGATKVG